MNLTEREIKELFFETLLGKAVFESIGNKGRTDSDTLENWNLADFLYDPDDRLISRLADYNQWCKTKEGEDPGKLMEEIALLAFKCLRGWESIKSYQSYAPQHDLVISGSSVFWLLLMVYLHLPVKGRTVIIEAKNLKDPVSDSEFSRLCSIVQNKFEKTCDLGVFFTRSGASGFPNSSELGETESRQRSLRDARATQILFHARTGKFVVVLDHEDLQRLTRKGALPKILEARIRDVEEAGGLSLQFNENWTEIDLPPHLSQYTNADRA